MTLATSPPSIASSTHSKADQEPLLLDVSNTVLHVTPEQFDDLCIRNPDLRLELTKDGELIVMPPTGFDSGVWNLSLALQVGLWSERTKLGQAADSSTMYDFTSIGGGKVSPDVSWVEESRLLGVETEKFISVVPDFVIELRSASDNLKPLQEKMVEFQRLGVKLGLLIDPKKRNVEVYRLGQPVVVLDSPPAVSCDDVLPGFTLDLVRAGIWSTQTDLVPAQETIPTTEQLAKDAGRRETVLRQLNRKLGELSPPNKARVEMLESNRLEALIDALFDFDSQSDLENWLLTDRGCRPG